MKQYLDKLDKQMTSQNFSMKKKKKTKHTAWNGRLQKYNRAEW